MTTELEKEFFKCFGIEPHWQYKVHQFCHFYCCDKKTIIKNAYLFKERKTCKVKEVKRAYPEITDRKLLEMICILVKTQTSYPINKSNIEDIKDEVLRRCVNLKSYIKQQIQQLFKEKE